MLHTGPVAGSTLGSRLHVRALGLATLRHRRKIGVREKLHATVLEKLSDDQFLSWSRANNDSVSI